MRCPRSRWFGKALAFVAGLVLAASLGLEAWCAADRAGAKDPGISAARAAAETLVKPSAAAFDRLAQAQMRVGRAQDAAFAAGVAARIAPNDAARADRAQGYLDAAIRLRVRAVTRPAGAVAFVVGLVAWIASRRRRRADADRARTLASVRGSLVLGVEGPGGAHGAAATLEPGAAALVVDVHLARGLESVVGAPPLVVTLSHAEADRTVRLAPRTGPLGPATRFRVTGDALREVARRPGRWRVFVRAGDVAVAEGRVDVAAARAAA